MTEAPIPIRRKRGLLTRKISDYEVEAIDWLQTNRIPRGELVAYVGPGGVAKSTIAADHAARLSTGRALPHDSLVHPPMNVGWCSAEDHPGRVLRPRFEAAGGDPERLFYIEGAQDRDGTITPVGLPADSAKLKATVEDLQLGLLVIDPLIAFTEGIDHHRADQLRKVTKQLSRIAQSTRCTIIVIAHTNKSQGRGGIDRVSGSVDLANTARQVLLVGRPDGDDAPGAIVAGKENLCPRAPAIRYTVESAEITDAKGRHFSVGRIVWGAEGEVRAADVFGVEEQAGGETDGSALEIASAFVFAELGEGPKPSKELLRLAREQGIATRTLNRACADLGVAARKEGAVWMRCLPS